MDDDADWFADLPWTPERRLEHRYGRLVDLLMADYRASYNAAAAAHEWRMADGENDPYDGPFYTTAAAAGAAAALALARGEAACEGLRDANAAVEAAEERLQELRAELADSRPWQRQRRERLRERIEQAGEALDQQQGEVWALTFRVDRSAEQYGAAAWIARVLGPYERARQAAERSAARTLGWRPGQPVPGNTPQGRLALEPGRQAPATPGNQARRARLPRTATDPSSITPAPPLLQPPHQSPQGPTAGM